MKIYGIIPARYSSTRLPERFWLDIGGKPMIQQVYERARKSSALDHLVVATDDDRVWERVRGFGGEVVKTSPAHPSGTDRVAEAVRKLGLEDGDLVVNIQATSLFLNRHDRRNRRTLREDSNLPMAALIYPIHSPEELHNPSVVKVVCDKRGFALYFSRSPMPYVIAPNLPARYYKHIGPYAYRMDFLLTFINWNGEIWNGPSPWSSCGRWRMDTRFAWLLPGLIRRRWTLPKTCARSVRS